MREKINKAVQGSGVILSDNHLAIIIKNKEGYLTLSRDLKPSKQV